jgi:hypothetical protein
VISLNLSAPSLLLLAFYPHRITLSKYPVLPFIDLYAIEWQAVSSGAIGIFPTEKDVLAEKDIGKELT